MEIEFRNRREARLYNDDQRLKGTFGAAPARTIRRRLDTINAVSCAGDLWTVPGGFHPLSSDRRGQIACTVTPNKRLILLPADEPLPRLEDGGIDWSKVTRLRVLEVTDYHGR